MTETWQIIPISYLQGSPFTHLPIEIYQMEVVERIYRGRQRYLVAKVIITPFTKQVLSFG